MSNLPPPLFVIPPYYRWSATPSFLKIFAAFFHRAKFALLLFEMHWYIKLTHNKSVNDTNLIYSKQVWDKSFIVYKHCKARSKRKNLRLRCFIKISQLTPPLFKVTTLFEIPPLYTTFGLPPFINFPKIGLPHL